MKLISLRMLNSRCYDDVTIGCGNMHALVGTNNAGKSTVMYALDSLLIRPPPSLPPSLQGDKVSLQLRGDIILEHLQNQCRVLTIAVQKARVVTERVVFPLFQVS